MKTKGQMNEFIEEHESTEGYAKGRVARGGTEDIPAVRQHEHVAAHLNEEDLREGNTMPVVPAVSVEHEDRRARRGKLHMRGLRKGGKAVNTYVSTTA